MITYECCGDVHHAEVVEAPMWVRVFLFSATVTLFMVAWDQYFVPSEKSDRMITVVDQGTPRDAGMGLLIQRWIENHP